ncbi:MAG: hypothetical protein ABI883_01075 [Chthoniobacterales bacterium]
MKKSNILKLTLGLATMAAVLLGAPDMKAQAAANAQATVAATPISLRGAWRVTRSGVDCQTGQQFGSFPALMTFHKGGTYTGDSAGPGGTPANGSIEHGVWHRETGTQRFPFRAIGNSYDQNGYAGRIEITGLIHVTSATTFTYTATLQFFDAAGNLVAERCGVATGERF